ncbi:MAG: sugar phosphate isomerase/epimerase [Clostridiales bacterium]|jgi:sugar phosphate isomerase/epimerase|nr:sugar phosphate isomerase/epimerase [Clostridiales bacterium]
MYIGTITCSYFLRIYDYNPPKDFNWGDMSAKWRAEFTFDDFVGLAKEIYDLGCNSLEIWEPTFSFTKYSLDDARKLKAELDKIGYTKIVYCIGGWTGDSAAAVEPSYAFAQALGADTVVGCIQQPEKILPILEEAGKKYGIRYAIENHPAPNLCSPEEIASAIEPYEYVGANIDTGFFNALGFDLIKTYELLKPKLYHTHLKDTKPGNFDCYPIGDGSAQIAELLKLYTRDGYKYMLSVELESETEATPGLQKSLDYIKSFLG